MYFVLSLTHAIENSFTAKKFLVFVSSDTNTETLAKGGPRLGFEKLLCTTWRILAHAKCSLFPNHEATETEISERNILLILYPKSFRLEELKLKIERNTTISQSSTVRLAS